MTASGMHAQARDDGGGVVRLADLTTMRIGGPAGRYGTAATADDLIEAVRDVDEAGQPLLLVAGGSNLVVADEGFPGTVVRVASQGIGVESTDHDGGVFVRVAAGHVWDDVVVRAVAEGWSGVEALSGIPGCTGSTPVQNVGAYGQDVSETIARVRVWDRRLGTERTLAGADCEFAYRDSRFKRAMQGASPRYVVLEVVFRFTRSGLSAPIAYADLARGLGVGAGTRVPLSEAREAVLEQRRRRGMVLAPEDHDTWSCGSFFTNPILSTAQFDKLTDKSARWCGDGVVPPAFPQGDGHIKTSAAWLIDRAGFAKGYGLPGPAALSTKHSLALTNRGSAGSRDILALAREVRDGVAEAFDVRLVNEPVLVGLEL